MFVSHVARLTCWYLLSICSQASVSCYLTHMRVLQVVLGRTIDLEWVGWKFLMVLDSDAGRIRKFVTSQHQGLSNLAGGGSGADPCGKILTFC